ncbi:MAG: tetratricopeptide repeat protein [Nitrospinota bacterium]
MGDFYTALVYHERLKQDPGSEELFRSFYRFMDRAIEKSRAYLKKHPKDALAMSYMGSAYTLKGRFHLKEKSYLDGVKELREGVELLKEALRLKPDLTDAYFCLGYYNYFVGNLPYTLSFLRRAMSLPAGDRKLGLRQLHRVMEEGDLARSMAKLALMDIYGLHEKKPKMAVKLARELVARYPQNPYLKIELGLYLLTSLGEPQKARMEFERVLKTPVVSRTAFPRDVLPRARLAMAQAELAQNNLEGLRAQLEPLLRGNGIKPRYIAPVAHLLLGEYYRAKGERKKALLSFQRALSFDNVGPLDWQAVLMGYPDAEAIRQAARARAEELNAGSSDGFLLDSPS